MVDAKQLETQDLSWFWPRGRTSSSGVPGVPVVGRLQAGRERRRGLQVPGEANGMSSDVVGELGNVRVSCRIVCCPLSPAAGEFTFVL
jgi:hypothetical protein